MGFFDYLYIVVAILFAFMTFLIVRGNFERKFNKDGERLDLIENESKKGKNNEKSKN
jgi:uncharacterized ion transporter superfamily protein YfcC